MSVTDSLRRYKDKNYLAKTFIVSCIFRKVSEKSWKMTPLIRFFIFFSLVAHVGHFIIM